MHFCFFFLIVTFILKVDSLSDLTASSPDDDILAPASDKQELELPGDETSPQWYTGGTVKCSPSNHQPAKRMRFRRGDGECVRRDDPDESLRFPNYDIVPYAFREQLTQFDLDYCSSRFSNAPYFVCSSKDPEKTYLLSTSWLLRDSTRSGSTALIFLFDFSARKKNTGFFYFNAQLIFFFYSNYRH